MRTASSLPSGYEGYAYGKFTVELHFPFLLQPSTTIYAIAFAEAGKLLDRHPRFLPSTSSGAPAWVRASTSSVLGFLGIDWAYGFDKVWGETAVEARCTSYSVRNSKPASVRLRTPGRNIF